MGPQSPRNRTAPHPGWEGLPDLSRVHGDAEIADPPLQAGAAVQSAVMLGTPTTHLVAIGEFSDHHRPAWSKESFDAPALR